MLSFNDLMIGDWVMTTVSITKGRSVDYPDRIVAIRYNVGLVEMESDERQKTRFEIAPIPLTPKILEKNGFKKQAYDGWLISENNGRRLIEYRTDYFDGLLRIRYAEEPFCDLSLKIKYVHELQHALRLCGIDKTIELDYYETRRYERL